MSERSAPASVLVVLFLAAIYACFFPLLALDTAVKALSWAPIMERDALSLVLFLEGTKIITGATAIAAAGWLAVTGRRAGAIALAFGLLFTAITFGKLMGPGAFPGRLQEWLARALLGAGVPRGTLSWLFGASAWPAWPAAAALLRFSAVFPTRLTGAALDRSAAADRRGMLRGSGFAGADVGALGRAVTKQLLRANAFGTVSLSVFAVALVGMHALLAGSAAEPLLWLAAAATAGLIVTNVRTGYVVSSGTDRSGMGWVIVGLLLAVFIFLISAAVAGLFASAAAHAIALTLISVAPATVISGLALSVTVRAGPDPRRLIDGIGQAGSVAFALVLVAGATYALARAWNVAGMIAAALSAAASIIGIVPVKRLTDRVRLAVLERASTPPARAKTGGTSQ